MTSPQPEDWRYPTDQERSYGLAYLRWLALSVANRRGRPAPNPQSYGVHPGRAQQIREDIEQLVRRAAAGLAPPRR